MYEVIAFISCTLNLPLYIIYSSCKDASMGMCQKKNKKMYQPIKMPDVLTKVYYYAFF